MSMRSAIARPLTTAFALLILVPVALLAQTGRVTGTVSDAAAAPMAGARVQLTGTRFAATCNDQGVYVLDGVAPGTYELRVQRLGSAPRLVPGVVVRAGQDTRVDVTLERTAFALEPIVTSGSRAPEKITDAPATITSIDASAIENTEGNSFAGALKQVKGLDYVQTGITAVAVNARGFNSAFNNRMLMLEDNRIAALVESGLPVGPLTTMTKLDLAKVEVLVGPGSALYGPDASNGVITLDTKDPRDYQGTSVDVSGGSRSFYDAQFRTAAMLSGHIGFKVTGEYQSARDFSNHNIYAPISGSTSPSPEIGADFNTNVARGGGALVYYFDGGGRLEANAGMSRFNGLGLTNVGRNQLKDYDYKTMQARYSNAHWFTQVYHTISGSGETYQLNGYAQNRLAQPTISDDSVRALSAFPGQGQLTAAEVQNSFHVGALNDARVTWGFQYRHDDVTSDRRWLSDRQTGHDVTSDQRGVYGQLDAPVSSWLRFVVAARYDDHSNYNTQFSPKAGILVTPATDQTFRLTFNRAFKSPSVLQTNFFFPDFQPYVGVFGDRDGFLIKDGAGTVVRTIDPIEPETNNTWELGYKGVIRNRLFVDVTGYYSQFNHFMSPLVVIANFLTPPAAGGPTYAFDAKTGAAIVGATGGPQIPLTYFNVGRATLHGMDLGVKWVVTPTVEFNGTTSIQRLDHIERKPTDPAEATAFNSPTAKFSLGINVSELGNRNVSGGLVLRHVTEYDFRSGVNVGTVPGFTAMDLSMGYALPSMHSRVYLNLQNVFACRSGTSSINGWIAADHPSTYAAGHKCGFGESHVEMLNTPPLSTVIFLGVRWDR